MITHLNLTGHLTEQDKHNSDYAYIAFEVPPNITRLEVAYDYDHRRDAADLHGIGNTIDIGIFDPRGKDFITGQGFRGWSGSDRDHFYIAEDQATPGYLAGAVQAGTWHIIFGLYHIGPRGCNYTIRIALSDHPSALGQAAAAQRLTLPMRDGTPLRQEARWYRGDLQCHTHHSDGRGSLATLISTAKQQQLDFLAVTDHNTTSHIYEYPHIADGPQVDHPLLLIPATEVTTYAGHMNVWGIQHWQEFRCSNGDVAAMRGIIDAAHQQGALASVNHPKTDGPPWEYGPDLPFDCMEIWQGLWPMNNDEALALWDSLLQQGRRIIAVGGSDYHQPLQAMEGNPHLLGNPTTWVYAEALSGPAILAAIQRGRVCISADVDGPRVILSAHSAEQAYEMGDTVVDHSAITLRCQLHFTTPPNDVEVRVIVDGRVSHQTPAPAPPTALALHLDPCPKHYARVEVWQNNPSINNSVMLACSNPIFFG